MLTKGNGRWSSRRSRVGRLTLSIWVTSDADLSRGRVAGSGSAPWPCIQFRLAVTERDSAERLWALCCRGLPTDCYTFTAYPRLMPARFSDDKVVQAGCKVWGVIKWYTCTNNSAYNLNLMLTVVDLKQWCCWWIMHIAKGKHESFGIWFADMQGSPRMSTVRLYIRRKLQENRH